MKKVLLQKFGTSPPTGGESSFKQIKRPSVYKKQKNRKAWSKDQLNKMNISASDRVASASLLALSPTFDYSGNLGKEASSNALTPGSKVGDSESNSTISSSSTSESCESRPHSPIVVIQGTGSNTLPRTAMAGTSTVSQKPKVKRVKPRLSKSKSRARNSVKMLSDENNKHLSACHRCGNVRKEKWKCTKCIHVYCLRCYDRMKIFYGEDGFLEGCPMCKRLCCCGANRSEFCQREVHCYKKCPAAKLAASFARQTDKIILYGQFAGASFGSTNTMNNNDSNGVNFRSGSPFENMMSKGAVNGSGFKRLSEMTPPEQLQHAATLLQMSPGTRRRAQSEIIRASSARGFCRSENMELPAWYDPIELAKMKQKMLEEGNDEEDLPSSVTGRIGAYTLKERRKKLERYLEKRTRRIWDRNVRYQCRKNIAVNRLRVRGRFISREEEMSLINAGFSPSPDDASKAAEAVAWIERRRKERSMSSIN